MTEEVRRVLVVGGRRITLTEHGTGDLLFCLPGGPGFPGSQLDDLGGVPRGRRMLALDWRGAGESDPPGDGRHGLADYAGDLDAVRDALGLEMIDVFGHSFGGLVAATYAASRPDRVRKLVLDGTPDLVSDGRAPEGEGLEGFFACWDDTARAYGERIMAAAYEPAMDWFGEHEYASFDLNPLLSRIQADVLVITGAQDWAVGEERARAMASACPRATVEVVAEAGHFAWLEQPAAYSTAVLGFLG
jgi:pimeloyl-ACP methyl ester carboxylesterase